MTWVSMQVQKDSSLHGGTSSQQVLHTGKVSLAVEKQGNNNDPEFNEQLEVVLM